VSHERESWDGPAGSSHWSEPPAAFADRPEGAAAPGSEHGRFEERDTLGAGGGGHVVRGLDRRLERDVALKIVTPDRPLAMARLRREAAILVALEHPAIVPLYDLVERPDGGLQLALRIVRGRSLEQAIAAALPGAPDAKARQLAHLRHLARAAEAVAWAHHRGFVHRDLKPANIMVGEFGETQVIDWGLAVHLGAADEAHAATTPDVGEAFEPGLTHAGAVLGTPRYMSPEQARGERVDARADVWSLGCILYEILVGRPAFAFEETAQVLAAVRAGRMPDVRASAPTVPPDLAAIIAKATEPDVDRRYPDARAFVEDLNAWLDGRPVAAHRYAPWQRIVRFVRRRPVPVAGLVAVAVTATALALAPRPEPEVIEDTRTTGALREGLREREQRLAESLVLDAEEQLAQGRTPEAAHVAARSLALADAPKARGVLALAGLDGPRLDARAPLPATTCLGRTVHPSAEAWLCRGAEEVTLFQAGRARWRTALRAEGAAFVAGGQRVAVLDSERRVVHLATGSGEVVERSEWIACRGTLATGAQAELAVLQGRLCLVLLDGENAFWAANGVSIQTAAAGRDERWALLTTEGDLVTGALDRDTPTLREPGHGLFGVERTSSTDLGRQVNDVSAMVMLDDAILLGTLRGELLRLDLDGRVVVRRALYADVPVTSLAASPSGRVVAVSVDRGGPALVEPDGFQVVARLPEIDLGAIALTDDRHALTLGSRVATWDLGPLELRAIGGLGGITAIAIDGRALAVAHERRVTRFELPLTGASTSRQTPDLVKSIAVRGDALVLSRVGAAAIERLDLALAPLPSPPALMVRRLGFSASGTLLALPYQPALWFVTPDDPANLVSHGHEEYIDLALHGDLVALLARSLDVVLLDVAGAPVELARCGVPGALAVASTPDGARFFVAHADGVMLIDAVTCGVQGRYAAREGARALTLTDIQVSPDGAWVAVGSREGRVLIWSDGGALVASARAHTQRVAQVSFDPRSRVLFSAGWDGVVRRHDLTLLVEAREVLVQRVNAATGL